MYISHHKIVYNHVSDVDIVSDLQNTQLYYVNTPEIIFDTILIVHPTSTEFQ